MRLMRTMCTTYTVRNRIYGGVIISSATCAAKIQYNLIESTSVDLYEHLVLFNSTQAFRPAGSLAGKVNSLHNEICRSSHNSSLEIQASRSRLMIRDARFGLHYLHDLSPFYSRVVLYFLWHLSHLVIEFNVNARQDEQLISLHKNGRNARSSRTI